MNLQSMFALSGQLLPADFDDLTAIGQPLSAQTVQPAKDQWVLGDLSNESPDQLTQKINSWQGSNEDLILMIMIAISKDMDQRIRSKADEVAKLRQQQQGKSSSDGNNPALDQAVQELQGMQKQRDTLFQMFQKILDSLTASVQNLLASWHTS
jgi:hypothetical protein